MKKINKLGKKGFTLLELMIVVAILVILASLSFINVADGIARSQNVQSRDTSRFVNNVQSQANYVRQSMLISGISGSPKTPSV